MSEPSTGYGKPPAHTRFKKGVSGNPSGCPKPTPSFRDDLIAEMQKPHVFDEDGQRISTTRQKALVQTLTSAALEKDMRAVQALLACLRHYKVGAEDDTPETVDFEDIELLQQYIDARRAEQNAAKHSTDHDHTDGELE